MPKKAVAMLKRSSREFCRTAEMMPIGKATAKAKSKAAVASSIVAGSRSPMRVVTGCFLI